MAPCHMLLIFLISQRNIKLWFRILVRLWLLQLWSWTRRRLLRPHRLRHRSRDQFLILIGHRNHNRKTSECTQTMLVYLRRLGHIIITATCCTTTHKLNTRLRIIIIAVFFHLTLKHNRPRNTSNMLINRPRHARTCITPINQPRHAATLHHPSHASTNNTTATHCLLGSRTRLGSRGKLGFCKHWLGFQRTLGFRKHLHTLTEPPGFYCGVSGLASTVTLTQHSRV